MVYALLLGKVGFFFLCTRTHEKGNRFYDHQRFAFSHRIDFKPDTLGQSKNLLCVQACVMRGQAKIKQREKLIQPALFIYGKGGDFCFLIFASQWKPEQISVYETT